MTAAVNVPARVSTLNRGDAGTADQRSALHGAALPAMYGRAPSHEGAPVIPAAAEHLRRRTFAKGEYLYDVGDEAHSAYIVEAGLIALTLGALSDRQRVVALAGPGDVVGALTPGPLEHQSGALALSGEVATRVLPAGSAYSSTDEGLGASEPEFANLLANAAGEQIQRLTWALEDSAHPVPARVARALLRLGQRFGHHTADGAVRLTLPVTHETLASLVGAARETTTYTIQQLRKKGLLVGTRGHYHFEPLALERYAHEAAMAAR